MTATPLTLAPALPHPLGTVRHVPDLVGAVLSASAVAAGVLAVSRGSAWGWLTRGPTWAAGASRLPSKGVGAAAFAVPPTGSPYQDGAARAARPPSTLKAAGTGVVLGGAIGVTGATVLIDRPFPHGPAPGHASVSAAVLRAAVLLAATALVRVAGASGRETDHRSQRSAAGEEPAITRRLLAEPREPSDHVWSAAEARSATSDSRVVNPR
ncbi:hypothetical protein [Nonomuraea sp. SYSU D8015]|uniref:hypothetical protein n=1 Tax=Nonomuraea sp. SYSU D8015 TaxID=2593644 RepID=UPI0016604088|nr:hypothetical protein [Nonomuraea sp. SYSU D8015]